MRAIGYSCEVQVLNDRRVLLYLEAPASGTTSLEEVAQKLLLPESNKQLTVLPYRSYPGTQSICPLLWRTPRDFYFFVLMTATMLFYCLLVGRPNTFTAVIGEHLQYWKDNKIDKACSVIFIGFLSMVFALALRDLIILDKRSPAVEALQKKLEGQVSRGSFSLVGLGGAQSWTVCAVDPEIEGPLAKCFAGDSSAPSSLILIPRDETRHWMKNLTFLLCFLPVPFVYFWPAKAKVINRPPLPAVSNDDGHGEPDKKADDKAASEGFRGCVGEFSVASDLVIELGNGWTSEQLTEVGSKLMRKFWQRYGFRAEFDLTTNRQLGEREIRFLDWDGQFVTDCQEDSLEEALWSILEAHRSALLTDAAFDHAMARNNKTLLTALIQEDIVHPDEPRLGETFRIMLRHWIADQGGMKDARQLWCVLLRHREQLKSKGVSQTYPLVRDELRMCLLSQRVELSLEVRKLGESMAKQSVLNRNNPQGPN